MPSEAYRFDFGGIKRGLGLCVATVMDQQNRSPPHIHTAIESAAARGSTRMVMEDFRINVPKKPTAKSIVQARRERSMTKRF